MIAPIIFGRLDNKVNFKSQAIEPAIEPINSFSQVDEYLYRGARPLPEQVENLTKYGISTVIDFSTEPQKIPKYSERRAVEELNMKYFNLPFHSWENPTDRIVDEFFQITDETRLKNEKMFAHCLGGRDRTGLFVQLYKIYYGLSNVQESLMALKIGKYRFSSNPLVTSFIEDFAKTFRK